MEPSQNRIVVKVGTSTLTHESGALDIRTIDKLAQVLSAIRNSGYEVILVSSGAIAVGVEKMRLPARPKEIRMKQAAAAVGQCELMYTYDRLFTQYNHTVAQLLLTAPDLKTADRHEKFENTMSRLIELGALPIINENDTVATEEIVFGDNDTLAGVVAVAIGADLLVLLSDIDGLYTADPHTDPNARLISKVTALDDSVTALAGGSNGKQGTGGMVTKLEAAKICLNCGCTMVIANGKDPDILYDILDGTAVCTRFLPQNKPSL